jgi:hypothetical protein
VLLVDRSMRTDSRSGAPIYLVGSALWSDCAEVRAEVECDLIKRSHIFFIIELLIAGYLLEELNTFRLLRPIMLIIQASLFGSH